MPIRIYDVAKKLGIESKRVLAKAKELGITDVRQASSSLDEVTAEYLEQELQRSNATPQPESGPVVIIPNEDVRSSECSRKAGKSEESRSPAPKQIDTIHNAGQLYKKDKEGQGRIVKCFRIKDGEYGHSYETLMLEYLRGVTKVTVEDPYIRKLYQILNFRLFCETCVKENICRIKLITGFDNDDGEQKQKAQIKLQEIGASRKKFGIKLEVRFDQRLHDREIRTDHGWCIKISRGLDICQKRYLHLVSVPKKLPSVLVGLHL